MSFCSFWISNWIGLSTKKGRKQFPTWFVLTTFKRHLENEFECKTKASVLHNLCCPDTPIMSCFMCVCLLFYVRLFSHLRLVCVGAWCLDSGTHVLSFGFVSGFGHSRSTFCLVVWVCGLGRALFCPRVLCCTQLFLSAACIHVMSCAVCHAACVFNWLGAFMLSCLVRVLSCIRTRGLWVLSFCTWLVICLLAMCLCFCFLWAHGFVLVFCVPCALMSICLDPTHLVNLPHLCIPRYPLLLLLL